MPANTSMQGTYIPQYTQVPGTNISVEVGSSCAALTQSVGLNPSLKIFLLLLLSVILTIYCFPAFRTAPSNSPLPSRRPRNTQATPTSITSEEVAVVGDRLPRCMFVLVCVWGRCGSANTNQIFHTATLLPSETLQQRNVASDWLPVLWSLCQVASPPPPHLPTPRRVREPPRC